MDRNLHFIRTRPSQPPTTNPQKKKNKMLILLLKRIAYQTLSTQFNILRNYSLGYVKKMHRMQRICSANHEIFLQMGWSKIKMYAQQQKNQCRVLKDIMILAKRIQRTLIQQSFHKLCAYINTTNATAYDKIVQSRKIIIWHLLKKVYTKNKRNAWTKLKQNSLKYKITKKLNIMHLVFQNAQKNILLSSWSKISGFKNTKSLVQKDRKIQDLQLQLQDMKIQVENKNQNISRLYDEITDLKQNSAMKPGDTSSFIFNNSYGNRSGTNLNRSRSRNSSVFDRQRERDKQSNDGSVGIGRDNSFGSLLGISVLSYRSRGYSNSNLHNTSGKLQSCACSNCTYRQKYQKYKATSQTLKKQLDIIKAQLDFTKDMNEHMQNQLNTQYNNTDQEHKLQKVRLQLRQCQRQRQVLREKVIKYEKYVAKLKVQFKGRIQQIYRKVKRNT